MRFKVRIMFKQILNLRNREAEFSENDDFSESAFIFIRILTVFILFVPVRRDQSLLFIEADGRSKNIAKCLL